MIKNTAFLAALTTFLLVAWLAGELSFLAPYKRALMGERLTLIGVGILLVFLNLCALYYVIARWLFVRDTGRKLAHLDRQLATPDAALEDLRDHLRAPGGPRVA
jgi:hypothetical protein